MNQTRRQFFRTGAAGLGSAALGGAQKTAASPAPPMIFEDDFAEHRNIAWRVERGTFDPANPLMEPAYPWDSACPFNGGTILKDPIDGLWKCWGLAFPDVPNFRRGQFYNRLIYATSEDGRRWTRPMLEGFPCLGRERSNVLLDWDVYGKAQTMSVLVDPDAKPARRYEMFIPLVVGYGAPQGRVIPGLPLPDGRRSHPNGLYRFFSTDGIHWKPAEGPLALETADSIFFSKEYGGPYVAYHKLGVPAPPGGYVPYDVGAGGERILARRESKDGTHWSPYQVQFQPDWRDAHDTQFMDASPVRQGSGFAAIVAIFHGVNQMMDLQFAGSRDGKKWFRPFPRVPCLANPPLGDTGGALYYNNKNLVEDGERLHHYYSAIDGLHGDVYGKVDDEYLQYGSLCRASWERGRLWAAVPAAAGPTEGMLRTRTLEGVAGKRLVVNAVTLADGEVTAELLEGNMAVRGFARVDARAFRGDAKLHTFQWAGGTACPRDGVALTLSMRRARLYGFEWREA